MADPTQLEKQFQQLRQATRLKNEAQDHLKTMEEKQALRWGVLRSVIQYAAHQYFTMRINEVEESLRDKSAPIWLPIILIAGVTLVPVSALTGSFLSALTTSTQKILTRADRVVMQSYEKVLEIELDSATVMTAAGEWLRLRDKIQRTEEMVAKFIKVREPEVIDTMQSVTKDLTLALGDHLYKNDSTGKLVLQTDVPVVMVEKYLNDWIDTHVRAENKSREMLRDRMRDLFDIATSSEPAKEARAIEAEAQKKEAALKPRNAFRQPLEELPKTSKGAMDQLTQLRDQLIPSPIEIATIPDAKDLGDLQLLIESMIWATTYDFSLKSTVIDTVPPDLMLGKPEAVDPHLHTPRLFSTLLPAPLPPTLWKRLIERYQDPDERKSYKEVGNRLRLGTKDEPYFTEEITKEFQKKFGLPNRGGWSPEVRLSFYFSNILYHKFYKENIDILEKYSTLGIR